MERSRGIDRFGFLEEQRRSTSGAYLALFHALPASSQHFSSAAYPKCYTMNQRQGTIMKRVSLALCIIALTIQSFSCPWLPDPATPSSPPAGASGISTEPTLQWSIASGAKSYWLQISEDLAFSSIVVDDSTLAVTSYQVSGLSRGTTYYWRVRASNSYGSSDWSTVLSFTTIVAPPDPPKLSAPADGSTGITTDPMLCWDPSDRATSYRLQVSTDSTFTTTIFDRNGITGTFFPDSGLTIGRRYYWRLSASNAGGTSNWSRVWTFMPGGL